MHCVAAGSTHPCSLRHSQHSLWPSPRRPKTSLTQLWHTPQVSVGATTLHHLHMPVHAGASYPTATWHPSGWGSLVWSTHTRDSAAHGSRPSHGELSAGTWQLRGARVARPGNIHILSSPFPMHQKQIHPTSRHTCVPTLLATPGACSHTGRVSHFILFRACCSYIRERDLDWAWWQIDGQQGPSRTLKDTETYGLLNTTWNGPVFLPLVAHLKSLG